jgi:hypothetical protein
MESVTAPETVRANGVAMAALYRNFAARLDPAAAIGI